MRDAILVSPPICQTFLFPASGCAEIEDLATGVHRGAIEAFIQSTKFVDTTKNDKILKILKRHCPNWKKCLFCGNSYAARSIHAHVIGTHLCKTMLTCVLCGKRFKSDLACRGHITTAHSKKRRSNRKFSKVAIPVIETRNEKIPKVVS